MNKHFDDYTLKKIFSELVTKIEDLENRIAVLESKPQETRPDRTIIDFEGSDDTKVPTGENESSIE